MIFCRRNYIPSLVRVVVAVFDSAATILGNEWNLACSSRSGNFNDVCCSSGVSFYPAREKKYVMLKT